MTMRINDAPIEITGGLSDEEVAEIIAGFGGFEVSIDRLRRFKAVCARLAAQWDELVAAHPDKWVMVVEDGPVFVCSNYDEFLKTVRRDDLADAVKVTDFLNSEPMIV